MEISIEIFLNTFEDFDFIEKLGQIFDLDNVEFLLFVEIEYDYTGVFFEFSDLTLGGASLNIPHHLKKEIVEHYKSELSDELDEYHNSFCDLEINYQLN